VYALHGYLLRAEERWRKAVELDPKNTACRLELASLMQRNGREREALAVCEQLRQIDPQSAVNYLRIGALNERLEQFEAAAGAYRKVVELAPQRAEGYRALAQLALRTGGDLAEAKRLAAKAVEVEPTAANYQLLCEVCQKSGDRAGAVAAIRRAVELEPNNAEYRQRLDLLEKRD
jgi:tetratricopeptide (TPR) repeat protein